MAAGRYRRVAEWLDVRPDEVRAVAVSFAGSFLVLSFLVVARSLREALYLDVYPVESLPYVTGAAAVTTIVAAGRFTAYLARREARAVLMRLCALLAAGLLGLWPFLATSRATVVAFYLWTATGTLLLGSGFWVVTSEHFPVRGAKRLFGLISAGGTLGAVLAGNSLGWLTARWDSIALVGLLVLALALLLAAQLLLAPRPAPDPAAERLDGRSPSVRQGLALAWRAPHLRTLALIVLVATAASTLVDYQFKEQVRAGVETREGLASFFGAFYGWTGGVALAIQLLVTGRLLAGAGVAASLSVLPACLLAGSAVALLSPGLLVATLLRGADNSLRRSLHRSVLEFLWVPLSSGTRRRVKPVVDSSVDGLGESLGSVIVLAWVTLPGLPSRWLSGFAIGLATVFLVLARRMGRRYFDTVEARLTEGGERVESSAPERFRERDLLAATVTGLDVGRAFGVRSGGAGREGGRRAPAGAARAEESPDRTDDAGRSDDADGLDLDALLASPSTRQLEEALARPLPWTAAHVPGLTRLLARDSLTAPVVEALARIGRPAVPELAARLREETTDFAIRRRIPRALARIDGPEADEALVDALCASRFEVRYRAALALSQRRRHGLARARGEWRRAVWEALRAEVSRERPVWELQRLLDGREPGEDDFVARRAGARGELSLEHTFRLLGFVLDPVAVRSAYHGIVLDDPSLKSFALEYLEQTLPQDVRERLWPFIGDASERRRRRELRRLEDVVSDLVRTGATLFGAEADREALRRVLDSRDRPTGRRER